MPASGWERFSALRVPCPGCVEAGYADPRGNQWHKLCQRKGPVIRCRKLHEDSPAPDGWHLLGEAPYACTAWRIPDGHVPVSRDVGRPRPVPRQTEAATDDQLDLAFSAVRRELAKLELANAGAVEAFFARQGAAWDETLYSILPTRAEEHEALRAVQRPAVRIPGLTARGILRAREDPDGGYIEWTMDREGRTVGLAVRLIGPTTGPKAKSHGPARVHHPLGWLSGSDRIRPDPDCIWITEGRRKANETQRRRKEGCLGLPGVAVGRVVLLEALDTIRAARPARLILAPDMGDLVDGEERHDQVRDAVRRSWRWIARRAEAATGCETRWATWDTAAGKGIDDALAAGAEIEFVGWDDYLDRWRWHRAPEHIARPRVVAVADPVRTIGEATERVGQIARSWRIGQESLALASFPGASKTTAFGRELLDRMEARRLTVGVLALPTRALVSEKAEILRQHRLGDTVTEIVGAGTELGRPFYCAQPGRRFSRAQVGRWGCEACPEITDCTVIPGRFRHDQRAMERRLELAKDAFQTLVVTTQDKLRFLHRVLPEDTAIVIDDVSDAGFGMIDEREWEIEDLRSALEHVAAFDDGQNTADGFAGIRGLMVPAAAASSIVRGGLEAVLGDAPDLAAALAEAAERFPDSARKLIWDKQIRKGPWDWEERDSADGSDIRPAATALVLGLFRATLHGLKVTRERDDDRIRFRVPDVDLITRVRAGRVAWLSVGQMPEPLADKLDVRLERIHADPEQLRVLAVHDRTMGVRYETTVQAVTDAIDAHAQNGGLHYRGRSYHSAGAVVRKRARQDLKMGLVRHYGAGHAATDDLAGCEVLVVSRYAIQPREVRRQAEAIARAFGIPQTGGAIQRHDWVGWGGHRPHRKCPTYLDELTHQVEMFHAEQSQLNAVGRCRPLSADSPRLAVILAGIPFGGLHVHDVAALDELCMDLDLAVDVDHYEQAKRDREEKRAIQRLDREDVIADALKGYIADHGCHPSEREWARRAKLPRNTLVRALREPEFAERIQGILAVPLVAQNPVKKGIKDPASWATSGTAKTPGSWPSVGVVAELAGMPRRTAARHLARLREAEATGRPPIPARSDAREGLRRVLASLLAWRAEQGCAGWGYGPVYGE